MAGILARCNSYGLYDKLASPGSGSSGTGAGCTDSGAGIVKNGLVAFWNLNGNFNDKWDCGTSFQTGTGSNIAFVADRFGVAGNAVNLAVSTGLVGFGNIPEYQTSPFSVCAWIRIVSGSGTFDAVKKHDGTNGWKIDVRNSSIYADAFLGNTGVASVSGTGMGNTWGYTCLTIDTTANPALVLYAAPYGGSLANFTAATASFTGTATNLELASNVSSPLEYDDVAFYKRALTSAEVQQNFIATEQ